MIKAESPSNETERLKALSAYNLLDTLPEEDFDRITYLASVICQTPISLISLIDKDRQFFKSKFGIDVTESHRDFSFCTHAINQPQTIFEVEDTRTDPRFIDNKFVIANPNIVFYAGVPLVDTDGFALGTLCVIDKRPRKLTNEQKEALTKLSKQVMFIIEAKQKKIVEEELKLVDFTFNNSAMPIFLVKEDSTIYNINEAAARNLGYSQEELKGKKVIELDDNFDKEKWALHWAEIKAKGSMTIDTTPRKKDGTIANLIIYINYLKQGDLELICSYSTDITEKKKQEEQMDLIDFAFRNSKTPVNIVNKDSTLHDFNEAAYTLLGYTKEEYQNISIPDLDPDYQLDIWQLHWEELKRVGSLSFESRMKKKNGELIFINVEANYIQYGDKELNCAFVTDITEKKKQKEQMALVDFVFRNSTTPINILSEDASIFDFNEAAHQLLGYTKEEYKAISIHDIDPDYQYDIWPIHWKELKKAKSLSFETKLKKKNGEIIFANIEANFINYGDKELNCVFFTDITEKKKKEERLLFLEHAFKKSKQITVFLNKDGTYYDYNDIYIQDNQFTLEELQNTKVYELHGGFDAVSWKEYWQQLKECGGMQYETQRRRKDGTLIDLDINAQIINYGSLEVNCIYINDITEKKKATKNLQLSAFTIENAAWGIVYFKEDGSVFDINLACAKLYGYASLEELNGKTAFDFRKDFTAETWKLYWEDIKEKKSISYIAKRNKKDGTPIDLEVNPNFIKFGDEELICVYLYDITESLTLVKSLKIVDFSFRNANIAMHFWRKDGSMFDFNDAACKLLDYTVEEYKKLNIVEVSHRHSIDTWVKRFEELKNGPNKPYITPLVRKDKSWVYVEIRSEIIVFEDLELCFSSLIDVTDKLKAEEQLKQSNRRYEYATMATSDVIWEADLVKKETYISKNFTTFFGHPVGDGWMPIENNIWRQNINPDDIDFTMQDQYAVLSSETSNNRWVGEYRLKKADGSYATVKDKTFAIKDENGNIVRMVGAMQDITKQRAEEERLRLMEAVVLNTNDAILIAETGDIDNPGPRITFTNPAFEQMTGYSADEIIGKTPRILQTADTDRTELDKLRKALNNWESCEITVRNKKKNGELFWVTFRVTPIKDKNGWFTHWVSVQRDVTKEKEAALEKENLLKELVENNLELKQFSYITSHNLRAPLTNLISICDIIQPGPGTDALTLQLIEGFKISTHHLNDTLNDLVEVLIIKENRNIQKDQLTFQEIFKKVKESLSMSLLEKKVILNADFSAAPIVTFANEYLESVFLNLLTNAVKYCHPDRDPIITIKTNKEPDGDTILTFSDNGIGINMALAKDKIFGLYKRFHNNANSKGIGLYLIHSQITTLGGKIEVESEVNIGTTFTITFK